VTGTYSDGSKKVESITAANGTGFNSAAQATDQILTITVGGKTTTYKVQIVSATGNTDTTGMTEMKTASSTTVGSSKDWTIKLSGLVKEPISSVCIHSFGFKSRGVFLYTNCRLTGIGFSCL